MMSISICKNNHFFSGYPREVVNSRTFLNNNNNNNNISFECVYPKFVLFAWTWLRRKSIRLMTNISVASTQVMDAANPQRVMIWSLLPLLLSRERKLHQLFPWFSLLTPLYLFAALASTLSGRARAPATPHHCLFTSHPPVQKGLHFQPSHDVIPDKQQVQGRKGYPYAPYSSA